MITFTPFDGLSRLDTSRHMLVVGKTGGGKSSLLLGLLRREIEAGRGAILLDPHGDLAVDVALRVPRFRRNDVTVFDPTDPTCRGLNPFARLPPEDRPLAVSNPPLSRS
jgi:DNA helicase HerA-like ATPase